MSAATISLRQRVMRVIPFVLALGILVLAHTRWAN